MWRKVPSMLNEVIFSHTSLTFSVENCSEENNMCPNSNSCTCYKKKRTKMCKDRAREG